MKEKSCGIDPHHGDSHGFQLFGNVQEIDEIGSQEEAAQ
jgi:hypothetical protein